MPKYLFSVKSCLFLKVQWQLNDMTTFSFILTGLYFWRLLWVGIFYRRCHSCHLTNSLEVLKG